MKVVERYILRRAFLLFIGTLASTLAIVWMTQALTQINLITNSGQSILSFLRISALILPSIAPEVLPFAVAIAVAQTFASMNHDSELVVINSAGSPKSVVARPILLLALGASLASFAFTNYINPSASAEFRDRVADARGDLINLVLQEGSFRQIEKGLYIQVGEKLPGGDLARVFVADSRQEGLDLVYYAKRGLLSSDGNTKLLIMLDGEIERKTPAGDVSIIRFDRYAFDLSAFGSAGRGLTMSASDRDLKFLLNPDPNDANFQQSPNEFRVELHRRFAEWTFPLVFALIGLAVASDAKSHRENRINPIITVVTLALLVRWSSFVIVTQSETSPSFVAAIYAVPSVAALVSIWFILTNRTMDLPVVWFERLPSGWLTRRLGLRRLSLSEAERGS